MAPRWADPTFRNDVMRPLLGRQVLAPKVPTDVHQFDGVQCAASTPRSHRGVYRVSVKRIFDGHQAAAVCRP
jgi:hypothetical protein